MKIVVGVTGSVAAIKLNELIKAIKDVDKRVQIIIVLTEKAYEFIDPGEFFKKGDTNKLLVEQTQNHSHTVIYFNDSDEWSSWKKRGDPVLHVLIRDWADLMLIAPLSANTMAKITNGICDNLLSSIVRCWPANKKIIVAPAMNTQMYLNPISKKQLNTLKNDLSVEVIEPIEKRLMCGEFGIGAMAEPSHIANYIFSL